MILFLSAPSIEPDQLVIQQQTWSSSFIEFSLAMCTREHFIKSQASGAFL